LSKNSWLVNTKKNRNTTGRELQVLKAVCIDAEKTAPFQNSIIHLERQRDRYTNFIISRTKVKKNVHGTDEQRKELKNKK
jgi:hypothetical protein